MDARKFLNTKNFKIEKDIVKPHFEDGKRMTATDKEKVYKLLVGFVSSHFARAKFTKALYHFFIYECDFIAHYDIDGFYDEYFRIAYKFHSSNSQEVFYELYDQIDDVYQGRIKEGIGMFVATLIGKYGFIKLDNDLDHAIKEIFAAYRSQWHDNIRAAMRKFNSEKGVA